MVAASTPQQPRTAPVVNPDNAPASRAAHLLRLHGALTMRDFWLGLRQLMHEALPADSYALEIGQEGDGTRHKIYRHAHPTPPPESWRGHPAQACLTQHPGAPVCRFSDVMALEKIRATSFYKSVMRVEGWDRRLSILSWRGPEFQGAIHLYKHIGEPDFTPREMRIAETLQPHFHTALSRVLAHEEGVLRAEQFAAMLEDVPVGLLLLDWDGRPLWRNGEAAHGCAVWNYGERRAAALKARRAFRVPPPLTQACAELRQQWEQAAPARREAAVKPRIVSEHALGLHAQISLQTIGSSPLLRPTFQIQLDYRRPRGDRNRALSPGAVALLARLSPREREVAMRMREGLRNAEIAAELRRSPLTIKTQLAAIFAKLGVKGRVRAVALLNR
jgi:DNA-binding CsgD family transcriptional regulator